MNEIQMNDAKEELRKSKEELRSMFIDSTVIVFSFILTVACIIPIIGPALVSYTLGLNKYRNETYGLSKTHILFAILISSFFLLFISWLIDYVTLGFFNPKMFWRIIIIALISNLVVSLILFFIGDRQAKKNKNKIIK